MRILLLNQCFYPDVVSTAQHLTDLAVELANRGHAVTVIAGDRGYDDPSKRFPRRETWNGIRIVRIPALSFGKAAKWQRALNFGSFIANCGLRLLVLDRFDVVVALTSPPLISLLGALFTRIKGGRFCFWVMDLNPDEAIAAGWLKDQSMTAQALSGLLRYSLRQSSCVVVLDRFMRQRILEKGISVDKIVILPPWSHDDTIHYDFRGREAFRLKHGLTQKFVVMYSGNHSPCHPLDTLMESAHQLAEHKEIAFCFVGGGSEQAKVKAFAETRNLTNVKCLPYQSLDELGGSLSAADLHVVAMGDQFVGIVHPCKIYNILTIGVPFLYIGPRQSHITDISSTNSELENYSCSHGDVQTAVNSILKAAKRDRATDHRQPSKGAAKFGKGVILPQMIEAIEGRQIEQTKTIHPDFREIVTTATDS